MATFNTPVSQEIIDDWADFCVYATAYMRKEIVEIRDGLAENMVGQFLDGDADAVHPQYLQTR